MRGALAALLLAIASVVASAAACSPAGSPSADSADGLPAETRQRLGNLGLDGADVLLEPGVAAALSIDAEQRAELRRVDEVNEREEARMKDQLSRIRFASEADARKFVDRYDAEARGRLLGALSEEQVSRIQSLADQTWTPSD